MAISLHEIRVHVLLNMNETGRSQPSGNVQGGSALHGHSSRTGQDLLHFQCLKEIERFLWGLPPSHFKITLAN